MNDRIKVRSASLNAWADQAEGIAAIVRDAQDLLKNVDMSPRWWDSVTVACVGGSRRTFLASCGYFT